MPPGPRRLPLAEKLWLFQRAESARESAGDSPSGRALGRMMSMESLEHRVRNRVRMFLRHTWLVAIVGTLALGGPVAAGVYYTQEREHLRIAAGPLDARFVGVLSDQIVNEHRNLHLQLVPTDSVQGVAQAMAKGEADLAILPSDLDDTLNWPVVAILRQNVVALIVPPPVKAKPEESAAKPGKAGKGAKAQAKAAKSAKQVRQERQSREERRQRRLRRRQRQQTANSARSPILPASASASSPATKRAWTA